MEEFNITNNPPRNIQSNHPLLLKNKGLTRALFTGAMLCPVVGALYSFKYANTSLTAGLLAGAAIGMLITAVAFALSMNSKKSLQLLRHGVQTLGNIESINIPTAGPEKDASTYVTLKILYKDNLGIRYQGNLLFMAKPSAFKKQAGETIDIVYMPDKPALFAAYLPEAGIISAQSRIVN